MPIYEYQCETCGEVRTELRRISERKKPLIGPCVPQTPDLPGKKRCTFKKILSPTPTTFRFNDVGGGFKGLTKRVNRK